jgi:hypothetical protein
VRLLLSVEVTPNNGDEDAVLQELVLAKGGFVTLIMSHGIQCDLEVHDVERVGLPTQEDGE